MNCAICGKPTVERAKFCGGCGAPLEIAKAPAVPKVAESTGGPAQPLLAMGNYAFGTNWAGALQLGFMLTVLTGLLVAGGAFLGGTGGAITAFVVALLVNFGSYWFSDKLVLMTTGARLVGPDEAPQLHEVVAILAERAGLPKPQICLTDDLAPNAFATGRDPGHAVVGITSGLLRVVNRDQLEGIMAHELAHIKHRDTLLSSVVAALAGAVMLLGFVARWGAFVVADDDNKGNLLAFVVMGFIAPLGALLVQMGISRAREYKADEAGAYICGKPWALADALERLEQVAHQTPLQIHPAAAHLFIVGPGTKDFFSNLFRTHPHTAKRAARLRAMGG